MDRSTGENYAACPARGWLIEHGHTIDTSDAAASGSEAHGSISRVIASLADLSPSEWMNLSPQELVRAIEAETYAARPDLQPDVIRGLVRSFWVLAKMLASTRPKDFLRFDGGEGEQSGQLAWPLDTVPVTVTSELDLLKSCLMEDPKTLGTYLGGLLEYDWKTGRTHWTQDKVLDSFQFQVHAWLVFNVYPAVNLLSVIVWNTREGRKTLPADFHRARLSQYHARVVSAAELFAKWHGADSEADVPRWPTVEKCGACSAASVCPANGARGFRASTDPAGFVDQMVAISARLSAMREEAVTWADEHGTITTELGNCFGRDKPPSGRKPIAALYQVKQDADAGEEAPAPSDGRLPGMGGE